MKKVLLALLISTVLIAINSPWLWNVYAAAFNDEEYRLPMAQLSLRHSERGQIDTKDIGPGMFTISVSSNGLAGADGRAKDVKLNIRWDGKEHRIVAKGMVYRGTFSAKPFTFSVSLFESRMSGSRIDCWWDPDPDVSTLTFSIRRAY